MNITEEITYNGGAVTFTRPIWLAFAGDRNFIGLQFKNAGDANYIRLTITTGGKTYTDLRENPNNDYLADISGYLRAGLDLSGDNPARFVPASVKIEAGQTSDTFGTVATLSLVVSFGATAAGDVRYDEGNEIPVLRYPQKIAYWPEWPYWYEFALSAYETLIWTPEKGEKYTIDGGAQNKIHRIKPTAAAAWFSFSVGGNATQVVEGECVKNPVYLKWYDRFGFERFWLFSGGEVTLSAKDGKDVIPYELAADSAQRYSVPASKTLTRKQKLGVEFSEPWVRELLTDLPGSPLVFQYNKERDTYTPVTVSSTSIKSAQDGRQRYEVEISTELPTPAL